MSTWGNFTLPLHHFLSYWKLIRRTKFCYFDCRDEVHVKFRHNAKQRFIELTFDDSSNCCVTPPNGVQNEFFLGRSPTFIANNLFVMNWIGGLLTSSLDTQSKSECLSTAKMIFRTVSCLINLRAICSRPRLSKFYMCLTNSVLDYSFLADMRN